MRIMSRERSIPIGSHGVHVSERNKHLIKAGMATIGALGAGAVIHPAVGVALGLAALYEVAGVIDHHEARKNDR